MAEEMSPIDVLAQVDRSGWERGSHGGRFVVDQHRPTRRPSTTVVAKETSTTDITDRTVRRGSCRRNQHTLELGAGPGRALGNLR